MNLRKLFVVFLILLTSQYSQFPTHAQTIPPPPPKPPRTPPPNQTQPAGGLNPINSTCPDYEQQLTALVPRENPVLTTSAYPTFFFYIPYQAKDIRWGEFSLLLWPGEKQRLYKTRFTLPQTPGFVSITLPSVPKYALEEGQYYHWYLQLYCQGNTDLQPDLEVNGWVKRVESATSDIWYDTLANAAARLSASPQDARSRSEWVELLQVINLNNLVREPLVGSAIVLED